MDRGKVQLKNTDLTNKEAAEYVIGKRYSAIDKKEDFSFETVLSSDYNMNVIRKAHDEGYFIKCIFVLTADPELRSSKMGFEGSS